MGIGGTEKGYSLHALYNNIIIIYYNNIILVERILRTNLLQMRYNNIIILLSHSSRL